MCGKEVWWGWVVRKSNTQLLVAILKRDLNAYAHPVTNVEGWLCAYAQPGY